MLPFVLLGLALWIGLSILASVAVGRAFAQQHLLPTPVLRRVGRVVEDTQARAA